MLKRLLWVVLIVFYGLITGFGCVVQVEAAALPSEVVSGVKSTADHSHFKDLDREFSSGPEVTKACLKCHNRAASQIHDTIHWTWGGRKNDKKGEGKVKTLNNF